MSLQSRAGLTLLPCLCLCAILPKWCSSQGLQATVSLDLSGKPVWNYTLMNQEPTTSGDWLNSFFLPIHAKVTNVVAPDDWTVQTDHSTYILWANVEPPPYPHDIPPGSFLSGFEFQSNAPAKLMTYQIASWNHPNDQPGPTTSGQVLAPGTQVVPEFSTITSLIGLIGISFALLKRRSRH